MASSGKPPGSTPTTREPHRTRLSWRLWSKRLLCYQTEWYCLQGTTQEAITRTVDIKGELNKPLKLEPVDYTLDKKVKFNIEEVAKGKHYRVTFTSIPNVGNYYQGTPKAQDKLS